MRRTVLTMLVLWLLQSFASEEKDYNVQKIKVSNEKIQNEKNISNLKFIPLEITPNIIIATIGEIQFYNEEYYILDPQYSNLMFFDNYGNYKRSIGGIGRGPGEFTKIRDFEIIQKKRD
ncbi:6-bladed beta-propeller [uncultured Salegentibacter sp.]|uniref:6-bladed beta-propeller n=1 Tax=uncultured Salegentibacter sp. TaxID=259320 RepID=UPI0030DC4BF7|tara:strand:- start:362 stop:718 length:357 start_codon:yes stop_codon:yes gene_type:complete